MHKKNIDLIVTVLIAAMDIGWALIPERSPVPGIFLVLPLVFVLPGYTLTEALFYRRPSNTTNRLILKPKLRIEQPFNISDRIILSLGLSLAIDVLSALVLNVLPLGLQALTWATFLGLLTTVFSFVAAYRRRGIAKGANRGGSPHFKITIYDGLLLGLAILVAVLSVLYATTTAVREQYSGFTELWLIPSNQARNSCTVSVGVQSFESNSLNYRVVMTINGSQTNTWSSIALAPQEEWHKLVPLKLKGGGDMYIEVKLYRADSPGTVYRNVHLTVHHSGQSKSRQLQQCVIGTQ